MSEEKSDFLLSDKREDNTKLVRVPLWGSCRLVLVILSYIGMIHIMVLRYNISMAIVCMTASNTTSEDGLLSYNQAEFTWSKVTQGNILSAFFYGYISTQIPGGWFSDKWGGKIGLQLGVIVLAVGSLVLPPLARIHESYVMIIRVLQGMVSGLAFPSMYNLFNVWASPDERATLMSLVFSGMATASIINYPLSSALCETGIDGGWPMVFYVPGVTGLLWCLAFQYLAYSCPRNHPHISAQERDYLVLSCKDMGRRKRLKVPWKQMATSTAVHVLWITHISFGWGFYLLAVNLPLFSRDVLKLTVMENGLLSSLPYVGMFVMASTGKVFDAIRKRNWVSLNVLRKIFNTIGFLVPATCMFALHLTPNEDKYVSVALLTLALSGHHLGITGGFYFSHADVAGPFAGILFGITNTMAQIPGFANALLVAFLTPKGTKEEWLFVFDIAGIIFILGSLVYLVFGTNELQPWAKLDEEEEETNQTRVLEKSEFATQKV